MNGFANYFDNFTTTTVRKRYIFTCLNSKHNDDAERGGSNNLTRSYTSNESQSIQNVVLLGFQVLDYQIQQITLQMK